jgi:hypothetical protein
MDRELLGPREWNCTVMKPSWWELCLGRAELEFTDQGTLAAVVPALKRRCSQVFFLGALKRSFPRMNAGAPTTQGVKPLLWRTCEISGARAILSGVQGLKALMHWFAARLKSCPDTKRVILSDDTDSCRDSITVS